MSPIKPARSSGLRWAPLFLVIVAACSNSGGSSAPSAATPGGTGQATSTGALTATTQLPPPAPVSWKYTSPAAAQPVSISVRSGPDSLVITAGELEIEVRLASWQLLIRDATTGQPILTEDPTGGSSEWGRLRFGYYLGFTLPIYHGYYFNVGTSLAWYRAQEVEYWQQNGNEIELSVKTKDPFQRKIKVTLRDFRQRSFQMRARVNPGNLISRLGMSFLADPDDGFLGFGERYNATDQRGYVLHNWSEEGSFSAGSFGSRSSVMKYPGGPTATYFPVPFFISKRGYGVEVETPYRGTFDMAAGKPDRWRFDVGWRDMGVNFYCGRTPLETFQMYVDRVGRSLIPPRWTFAPWNQMSGQIPNLSMLQVVDEYINRDIPTSLRQGYTHFFPQGAELGQEAALTSQNLELEARGLKSTCYFNPYVGKNHPTLFSEGKQKSYFVKKANKTDDYVFQYMSFKAAEVDFTYPAATKWYQDQLQRALDMGFDGCMYDFGEYTPVDARFYDGKEGFAVHNEYPLLYQKAAFDLLKTIDPDTTDSYAPEFVPYVRSGYSGSQSYVWAHWTGDPSCDWTYADGLPAQIPAGLNIGLAGIPFSGSDIGGFAWYVQPPPSRELYIRWTELGCFSGIMRDQTGGLGTGPKTQIFDWAESIFVWRKYAKLRTALFPYIYTLAHEARATGLPIMRHEILHFPDDPVAASQSYQYLFGSRFLVAPVIDPGQTDQDVYLPAGESWIDVNTPATYDDTDGRWRLGWSEAVIGGQTVNVPAPEEDCPLFVRAGTIVATLDPAVDTLNDATDPRVTTYAELEHILHLWVFPDATGAGYGQLWDGSQFRISPTSAGQLLEIFGAGQKTIIAQIPLGPGGLPSAVVADQTGSLTQASSWQDLVGVQVSASAWAWDPAAEVLWIRLEAGDRKVEFD